MPSSRGRRQELGLDRAVEQVVLVLRRDEAGGADAARGGVGGSRAASAS